MWEMASLTRRNVKILLMLLRNQAGLGIVLQKGHAQIQKLRQFLNPGRLILENSQEQTAKLLLK